MSLLLLFEGGGAPVEQTGSFTLDAVLLKTQSGSGSLDAIVLATQPGSATLDAVIFKTQAANGVLDAVLLTEQAGSAVLGAIVLVIQSGSGSVDAIILKTQEATLALDAVVQGEMAGSASLDAELVLTVAGAADLDAVLLKEMLAGLALDAIVQGEGSGTLGADAVLLATLAGSSGLDAVVLATTEAGSTLDAVVQGTQSATFGLDAYVEFPIPTFGLDAVLLGEATRTFGLDAVLATAPLWQHHRTDDHFGTEGCDTVELAAPVGRYAAGTLLCEVLDDLRARLAQLEIDEAHGFSVFGMDAFIAPYDPGAGGAQGFWGLDAWIAQVGTDTFGLDAVLAAPVAEERAASYSLSAWLIERGADGITVLVSPIDADDTVITVDENNEFPATCPYLIQIGGEVMTVVGGCGTNTWTVERGENASSHPAGSYVVIC